MRLVVQRVARAQVSVDGEVLGSIGPGLCVLVGATHTDTPADADRLADKVWGLRQGARDYITKPVNPAELWSKISALE